MGNIIEKLKKEKKEKVKVSFFLPKDTVERLEKIADELGYTKKGKSKLLERILEYFLPKLEKELEKELKKEQQEQTQKQEQVFYPFAGKNGGF